MKWRSEFEVKNHIVEVGRRLYQKGLVVATEGNISVRWDEEVIFTTPAGAGKGFLQTEEIIKVDSQGRKLEGKGSPSSELPMHLTIYRLRPDVHAVVHAHPPFATSYAAAGIPLNKALLAEIVVTLGCIPVAEYGMPSSEELPAAIESYVPHYDALLLANHGAVVYASDLDKAYFHMETVEHFARINTILKILGREQLLPQEEVEKLFEARPKYGITSVSRGPGCPVFADDTGSGGRVSLSKEELIDLIEKVLKSI
ncbi:MAG: class II aldolase/adducin family protein [Acidobacteria bacterium]|nr:class II aldolase/adducin family protein [Acidobacteriota bacterium]